MKKFLAIISSLNGSKSNTTKLANDIVDKIRTKYPHRE